MGYLHIPGAWTVNTDAEGTWDGTATNKSLKAAPGAKLSHYIRSINVVQGATSRAFSFLSGSGGAVLFKTVHAANGGATYFFDPPLKVGANTALCLTSAGGSAGAMVCVSGVTEAAD